MNVREELIEEYKEGNVFKKALLIVIGIVFGLAAALIMLNIERPKHEIPDKPTKPETRTLCELDGKLCIIDAKASMPYKDFIQSLLKAGAQHAIYLDMGSGWNYSYYRDNVQNDLYIELGEVVGNAFCDGKELK